LSPGEIDTLDVQTPDSGRVIIKPIATSDGDLYRVEASVPKEKDAIRCLARVYRVVNMIDIPEADPDTPNISPEAVESEVELLRKFVGKKRTVGWFSKIFQRDLLVGAHGCNVSAESVQYFGPPK
jgi:hypothetical protein